MKYDVVTIGTATKDYFLKLAEKWSKKASQERDFVLPLGAKVEIEKVFMQTGGGATNTAVSFSRLGLKTGIITKIGNDESGNEVHQILKKNNVDYRQVLIDKEFATAMGIVLSNPFGERTILVYRGASANMHPKEVSFNIQTIWWYICSLAGSSAALFPKALAAKGRKAVNPGKEEIMLLKKKKSLLKKIDVLIMNLEEAGMLVSGNIETMAKKLNHLGVPLILITNGRKGGVVYDGSVFYHYTALKVKPVNTLGAGDAFGSSFVAGLIRHKNIEESLQLASVNTTNVVRHIGAKVGLLKESHIALFEKKYGKISITKKKRT